jgi:hypothetical protein
MADKIPSKFLIKDKQIQEEYLTSGNLILVAQNTINNMILLYQGEANFVSSEASPIPYAIVTFSPALPSGFVDDAYSVLITPVENPGGELGEFWVDYKTQNSFRVYITGTATTKFNWFLFVKHV